MFKKVLNVFKSLSADPLTANRKYVGSDRLGNKYFQYYEADGSEGKRECEYKGFSNESVDPVWYDWLRKYQKDPYTEEQLKEIYRALDEKGRFAESYRKSDQMSRDPKSENFGKSK